MRIVGIETSCDETGVAIYDSKQGLLGHALHSQIALHSQYGGVVPELASRDHVRKIIPLLKQVMTQTDTSRSDISGIAYTAGPGLMGALMVGASTGRSLAWGLGIPSVAIHHMEGHLLAPLLEERAPQFPFLALLVSGGHTLLVNVQAVGRYRVLGESLDDAAGEAFDKTAKILGLPYPGGPNLAKLAESGDSSHYRFPRPMTNRPGLDFSFSGLKTFALNTFHASDKSPQEKADIARAFQDAVIDTLAIKCKRSLKETGLKRLVIAGGVSANTSLRKQLQQLGSQLSVEVFYPRPEFCTDNGAMIAYAGFLRLQAGTHDEPLEFSTRARWPLEELQAATAG